MTDLGTLGGETSQAHGINGLGDVVGSSATANGTTRAFRWRVGVMTNLPSLAVGKSAAYAVNDAGQIAGRSNSSAGYSRAVLWEEGAIRELTGLGGSSALATDINETGTIVGGSDTAGDQAFHACLWTEATEPVDIGGLTDHHGQAVAVNDISQVVGFSSLGTVPWDPLNERAWLWENGSMTDLGTLGGTFSQPYDINNSRQIVGQSNAGIAGEFRAFLWEAGVMYDLNDLIPPEVAVELICATAINDAGQIVALANWADGQRAVLLDPIPEPTMLALVLFAAPALLAWTTRRVTALAT